MSRRFRGFRRFFYFADLSAVSFSPADYVDLRRFLFTDGLVIILPFLLGLMTKLDGMVGTMVVTGEAGEAVIMMQPYRELALSSVNVVYRTDIGTDTTFDTAVNLYMKTLVGDENVLEETADDRGHEPRQDALDQSDDALFSVKNFLADNL